MRNLLKGLVALAVIVVIYILLQKYTAFEDIMEYVGKWPIVVYTIFIASEVVFGIIPPELFMIWSINSGAFDIYGFNIALLAVISYAAGVLGYFIGTKLNNMPILKALVDRYVKRYRNTLNRYGGLLIIVGALTPLPFSAVCMLVGSTNYNFPKFLLLACVRLVRFAAYAFVIYKANI